MLKSSILGKEFVNYRKLTNEDERITFSDKIRKKGVGNIPVVIDSVEKDLSLLLAKHDPIFPRNIRFGFELDLHMDIKVYQLIDIIKNEMKNKTVRKPRQKKEKQVNNDAPPVEQQVNNENPIDDGQDAGGEGGGFIPDQIETNFHLNLDQLDKLELENPYKVPISYKKYSIEKISSYLYMEEKYLVKNCKVEFVTTKTDNYDNEISYFKLLDKNIDQKSDFFEI